MIIEYGTKHITSQDIYGWTPLHVASQMAGLDVIKLLVDAGGDRTTKNIEGQSPVDLHGCRYFHKDESPSGDVLGTLVPNPSSIDIWQTFHPDLPDLPDRNLFQLIKHPNAGNLVMDFIRSHGPVNR